MVAPTLLTTDLNLAHSNPMVRPALTGDIIGKAGELRARGLSLRKIQKRLELGEETTRKRLKEKSPS